MNWERINEIPINLVNRKPYTERLNMRNNMLAYKVTKDDESYIGTYKDISKVVGYRNMNISSISLTCKSIHGWTLERVGMYKKVFKLYKGEELIFNGFVEDMAYKLQTTELRVVQLCNHDLMAMGKYKVKFDGEFKMVEMNI